VLVQEKIRECNKDVLIGQLCFETTLLTVKQNNDLLCHSQLDGSHGCVKMICYYQILVTEHNTVSDILNWPSGTVNDNLS
jgi:hypothetical protein